MRIAYFDCFNGISGDMAIAAFLDAGLKFEKLARDLKKLKINGYKIKKSKVRRGGLAGTKFDCIAGSKNPSYRTLKEIFNIIDKSSLNKNIKETAKKIFTNIGNAEMKIHGVSSPRDIHFHELGDIDSVVDIVGVAIALDQLGIDEVYSSKINMGRTFVNSRHGKLPIPGPAALEMLKGVPLEISDVEAELVTPTGAGILKTLSKDFGEMPEMKVSDVGYGAGARILENTPNMLRVIIGEKEASYKKDKIYVIETNIDDMNPQNFEYLFEKLLKEGALDVYTTTIQMKKSRPAFKLTVLANHSDLSRISSAIFSETTTIGLRFYEAERLKLERKITKVKTRYGDVRVKLSSGPGQIFTASPEYEDCARIARKKNVPLKRVYEEAKSTVKV